MPKAIKSAVASDETIVTNGGQQMSAIWMAWRDEAFRFAQRRLSHNQDAVLRLTKCSNWQELLELQMDWSREILEDYMDESRELFEVVSSLSRDISVLFIEHDMNFVFRFASRIIVMVGGSILLEGPPDEIAADARVREVYLGKAGRHG